MSKRITYFDSRYTLDNEEFLEYCANNDVRVTWDNLSEFIENDRMCLYENLSCMEGLYLMHGTLGLWSGKKEIAPRLGDIEDLVRNAIYSGEDAEVYLEDGILNVNVFHHDGTNHFEIRPLVDNFYDLHEEEIDDDGYLYGEVKDEELQKFGEYLY